MFVVLEQAMAKMKFKTRLKSDTRKLVVEVLNTEDKKTGNVTITSACQKTHVTIFKSCTSSLYSFSVEDQFGAMQNIAFGVSVWQVVHRRRE